MKKILFVLMACVLCIGLVGGAFAYFTDTESSTGNTFTAGTLDLKIDQNPDGGVFDYQDGVPTMTVVWSDFGNMAPGFYADPSVGIQNAGTIEGVPGISFSAYTETAGPDTTNDLDDVIWVEIYYGEAWPSKTLVTSGYLSAMGTATYQAADTLGELEEGYFVLVFSIDGPSVGNEIQGDTISDLDIVLRLDQNVAP